MATGKLVSFPSYAAGRDALRQRIVAGLSTDGRFGAAWLTGSFGRLEQDDVSDLDLSVLTTAAGAELLANTALRGGTAEQRRSLFAQFADPVIIHENPYNAPPGSSFSVVVYQDGPYMVDWTLLPPNHVQRPHDSVLLFDHVGVHVLPPVVAPSREALAARMEERWAFFWMMAVVTAKYWLRGDEVMVVGMLDQLARIAADIRSLLSNEPPRYRAASRIPLARSRQEQADALRHVCTDVDGLVVLVRSAAGSPVQSGFPAVETLLRLHPVLCGR